ncbi:response regulator transcription factor [Crocinitomicaceae bacterium]|nr:response regulator transcription factor [Crocinitomicaceae bacterium]
MDVKILLVEDDTNLGYVIKDQLTSKGYTVDLCVDGEIALKTYKTDKFDLCILDVMMPKLDGFSLAKSIRVLNKNIPILFLSARSMTEDRIEGFKVGGDDYLTKPFSMEELQLRINSLLRRSNTTPSDTENELVQIGEYYFSLENFTLKHPNFTKTLTRKEAEILTILSVQINKVVERDFVLKSVWGQTDYFVGRSLDVFVTKLRKYLSEDKNIQISNIHGIGFKLEVKK